MKGERVHCVSILGATTQLELWRTHTDTFGTKLIYKCSHSPRLYRRLVPPTERHIQSNPLICAAAALLHKTMFVLIVRSCTHNYTLLFHIRSSGLTLSAAARGNVATRQRTHTETNTHIPNIIVRVCPSPSQSEAPAFTEKGNYRVSEREDATISGSD